MPQCNHRDGCAFSGTLRQLKRHYKKEHNGEVWTPEEYLPDDQSEQREFGGKEPDDDEHTPEHEETNEPTETERTSLREYAGDDDE